MPELTQTSPELRSQLAVILSENFLTEVSVYPFNSGGGCMVLSVDLTQDGREGGRQLWITREERWVLGFYDFASDVEDEGVCVELCLTTAQAEDAYAVSLAIAGILARLGVEELQG